MLIENANCTGATIEVGNCSAKQHLIPALKVRKATHPEMTVVNVNLAYDNWEESEYKSAFSNNLALQVLAHNGAVLQAAASSSPATNPTPATNTAATAAATSMMPPVAVAGPATLGQGKVT